MVVQISADGFNPWFASYVAITNIIVAKYPDQVNIISNDRYSLSIEIDLAYNQMRVLGSYVVHEYPLIDESIDRMAASQFAAEIDFQIANMN